LAVERFDKDEKKGLLTFDIRIFNQRDEKVLVYLEKVLVSRWRPEKGFQKSNKKEKE
jgi:acyl dehydratase